MPFAAPAGTTFVEALGSGSVFEVALVNDGKRPLVCKRLRSRVRDEFPARAAMIREARFLSLARHASLPSLIQVDEDDDGPFVLETQIEGWSLRNWVDTPEQPGSTARPRNERAARVFAQVVSGRTAWILAELHALRDHAGPLALVHGDLSPDHVRVSGPELVRLVDFGAARFRGMDASLDTGDRGTLPYVAPEVARGEVRPSQATDVYALAATLLFFATGEPIAEARDEGALLLEIGERGIHPERAASATALGDQARRALARALAFHPADRITTANELASALWY